MPSVLTCRINSQRSVLSDDLERNTKENKNKTNAL